MKKTFLLISIFLTSFITMSQVGINNTDPYSFYVTKNGFIVKGENRSHTGSGSLVGSVETIEYLNGGDYISVYFSGTGLTISNDPVYTSFEVERIR